MSPPTNSVSTTSQGEVQQRFRRLRRLIEDDGYRIRLFSLVSLLFLAGFGVLAFAAITLPSLEYDINSTLTLQRIQVPLFAYFMFAISALGYMPWSVLIVIVAALLVGRLLGWKEGVYLVLLTAGQGALNSILKVAVNRPRPTANLVEIFTPATGASFPSGHVMFYTVFFGYLFFLAAVRMPRSWLRTITLIVTGIFILFIGLSRMYLGAHWLSDVTASYLVGLVILMLAIEGYVHFLAPRHPGEAEGVVGEKDKATAA